MHSRTWTSLLLLALLAALAAPSSAQNRPKIPPPEVQREWELDAAGTQRVWKPYDVVCTHCKGTKSHVCEHCKDAKVPHCLECNDTKRATCRTCAGTGKLPDPLVELTCPYCWGSSWTICGLCNSFGSLTVDGKETKCGACKEQGLFMCLACDGTRRVSALKLGRKSPGEAKVKDLQEALANLKAVSDALAPFEPEANPSRSSKTLAKILDPLTRDLKVVDSAQKMLEGVLKGVKSYGAGYSSYEERLIHQFLVFKDRTTYLLQHQTKVAELSLELAQFNETKKSAFEATR